MMGGCSENLMPDAGSGDYQQHFEWFRDELQATIRINGQGDKFFFYNDTPLPENPEYQDYVGKRCGAYSNVPTEEREGRLQVLASTEDGFESFEKAMEASDRVRSFWESQGWEVRTIEAEEGVFVDIFTVTDHGNRLTYSAGINTERIMAEGGKCFPQFNTFNPAFEARPGIDDAYVLDSQGNPPPATYDYELDYDKEYEENLKNEKARIEKDKQEEKARKEKALQKKAQETASPK